MELAAYLCVMIAAVAMAIRGVEINRYSIIISIIVFFVISIVVRTTEYDSDIQVYVERMYLTDQGWYFFREPIIWYSHRILVFLTKSELITLVVTDLLIYAAIVAAFSNLKLPAYALLSVIIFVPFVLGMQNVYRQWAASAFLLLAISRSEKSSVQGFGLYIVAALSHNAAAFFLPLVGASTRWRHSILIISIVVLPVALYFGRETRLASHSGADLGLAYFLVFSTLTMVWWWFHRQTRWWSDPGFLSLLYVSYVVGVGVLLLSSSGAERLGLFGLLATYPILVRIVEEKMPHWLIRSSFIVCGFLPLLVFETRQFLV